MLKSKEKHKDESFYHRQSWNMAHDQGGGGYCDSGEQQADTLLFQVDTAPRQHHSFVAALSCRSSAQ